MSDIQEEQKRLYKRAKENDKEQEINNKFARIVRDKMKDKSAVEMIVLQDEEINKLNNIINKAIEYIKEAIEDTDIAEVINTDELLNISQGE